MSAVELPVPIADIDFGKGGGLVPVVVQHARTKAVLMIGYADAAAVQATVDTGNVTFHSRSRDALWTKGETSGNFLRAVAIDVDCDRDAILVLADPVGPTCHTGAESCFDTGRGPQTLSRNDFLAELAAFLRTRDEERPAGSYTTSLYEAGTRRIAQKVGEEGVETALASVAQGDEELTGEAADLLYHLIVLLRSRGLDLADAVDVLRERHR